MQVVAFAPHSERYEKISLYFIETRAHEGVCCRFSSDINDCINIWFPGNGLKTLHDRSG
jgi:hypothetical protein